MHFSPDPSDPDADILGIEACSSLQNQLNRWSRFAASTSSALAVCPVAWLLAPCQPGDPTPRWKLIGVLKTEPAEPLILPVRDIRVLCGLTPRHDEVFARTQMPQGHEYFCPMNAWIDEQGHENPEMRALLGRASAAANFMRLPG
ncbi:hypothetical protein [Muricoccus radiodurans]|uniref:hypothetical protein n=1 Tax=Muricoccus radiodurans TaxID=2231721 RepID=UPI003CE6FFC9